MSRARSRLDFEIRPYQEEDESRVLGLLETALGGGPAGIRPPEFFRWKHFENPFGRSLMLVAETDETIIGLRAFMRWRFATGATEMRAVSAVDTATHPDYQGQGVFSTLTSAALEALRGEADLVFNTPNEKSLPGYLKMGWKTVGRVPILLRVRRPMAFLLGVGSLRRPSPTKALGPKVVAGRAEDVLHEREDDIAQLLADAATLDGRLRTPRDFAYFDWRYARAPLLDYRAVTQWRDGRLSGLGIFRVRPRGMLSEATVTELVVRPGDLSGVRALLRNIRQSAQVDHLTCYFPRNSVQRRMARRGGYVKTTGGITFTTKPLRDGLHPDPTRPDSWALSLGDLEVF